MLLLSQLGALPALANDSTQAADRHFTRGLSAAGAGKMALAASEFERAYEAVPHYSVLYNLGLVYASLGRNADAVRVLGRYLSDGGEQVSERRRKEVAGIVSQRSVGLSHVRLQIEPEGGTVTLDARTLAPAELGAPTPIDPGRHLLSVRRDGYETAVLPFDVAAAETASLEVKLTALTKPEPAPEKVAFLACCPIPDVELSIDGEVAAPWSPDVPHVVTPGSHLIGFARLGYAVDERESRCEAGNASSVGCVPRAAAVHRSGDPGQAAPLEGSCPRRRRRFLGGTVPAGRHRVTVLLEDYLTWQRDVEMPQGRTTRLEPPLSRLRSTVGVKNRSTSGGPGR